MEVMARYGCFSKDSAAADVAWRMGRIMLKFRPIAPKPVSGGGGVPAVEEAKQASSKRGRKRKASSNSERVRERKYLKKAEDNNFVTLSLMPVTPERKSESPSTLTPSPTASDGNVGPFLGPPPVVMVAAPRPVRPIGSWVTVECVTDTWRYWETAGGGGGVDFAALEEDACPLFLSEGCDRVTWTNTAYRRMVVGPTGVGGDGAEEVRVALVSRGLVPEVGVSCFTCRVRVRYVCRRSTGKVTMVVPCDAWRVGEASILWRLDVKAALSLGNSSVC